MRRRFILIAVSLALASCGDDGSGSGSGGGGGGGVTANQPPVFTSGTAVTVPENTAGAVYTVTANDPEGKAVTYTISGGADAARFTINASGAVSFITPPDFEHPTDSDANNTYLITVSASDGVNTVAQNVTITVSDVTGEGIQVRQFTRVEPGPIHMTTIPGDRRFAVVAQTTVWLVDSVTGANSIMMSTILDHISNQCGIRIHTIAFSPNFATDRTLYAGGDANCDLGIFEIRRFQVDASGVVTGNGTRVLYGNVNFYDSALANTRLDEMRFGPDGLLYVTTGDRSNDFGKTPGPRQSGYTRDLTSLGGKVLRIDVNGDDFPADPNRNYRIPAGNPFAGGGGAPEIFAYGFHLPLGIEFNGTDMIFADRGYGDTSLAPNPVHEINLLRPADAGGDYGFYNCQGDRDFSGTGPCTFPTILPVIQAPVSANEFRFLIGGIVYNGPIVDLRGQYIFAFGGNGRTPSFWSVPVAQLTQGANLKLTTLRDRTADFQAVGGVLNDVMSIGKDLAGNAYILDSDGDIFVIAPPA